MSNKDIIFKYLTETMELNIASACGVLANIYCESGYNPTALGDNGTSYGICQWHAGRWENLKKYCDKKNLDWHTLEGQLCYLEYELENNYPYTFSKIKNVDNDSQGAYDAAYYWCLYFEVPADTQATAKRRGSLGREFFEDYNQPAPTPTPTPTGDKWTGGFPTLPSRGYYLKGDGYKTYTNLKDQIKLIQEFLNWAINAGIEIDGCYGPNTAKAVKDFQKVANIKQDSSYGEQTLAKAKSFTKSAKYYVVKEGDTLSEIAAKYNTTVEKLAEINGISNPDLIVVGQKIYV